MPSCLSGIFTFVTLLLLQCYNIAAQSIIAKNIHELNPRAYSPDQASRPSSPRINNEDDNEQFDWQTRASSAGKSISSSGTKGKAPTPHPTKESGLPAPVLTVGHSGTNVVGCVASSCTPLIYQGGETIATPTFYVMWYGAWDSIDTNLVEFFLQRLDQSPYSMVASYPFRPPTGQINWGGSIIKNEPNYNKQLSDLDIQALVTDEPAWATKDPNGLYFILTSSDVNATSGFCRQYCGFHTSVWATRYIWVGNSEVQCASACTAGSGPNGRRGADGMINILLHEITESVTDPWFDGYINEMNREAGDLCGWTFGTTNALATGAKYNIEIEGTKFLVQRLVDFRNLNTQACALVHDPIPPTPQGGDFCSDALPISVGTLTAQTTYGLATAASPPMTFQPCTNVVNDLFYELNIVTVPTVCSVDTCEGDFDSVINIYTSCGATQRVACNDDFCGSQSNVTFTATQNKYIIGVGNYALAPLAGTFNLRVTCAGQSSLAPTVFGATYAPTSPTQAPPTPAIPTPPPTRTPTFHPTRKPTALPTARPRGNANKGRR